LAFILKMTNDNLEVELGGLVLVWVHGTTTVGLSEVLDSSAVGSRGRRRSVAISRGRRGTRVGVSRVSGVSRVRVSGVGVSRVGVSRVSRVGVSRVRVGSSGLSGAGSSASGVRSRGGNSAVVVSVTGHPDVTSLSP